MVINFYEMGPGHLILGAGPLQAGSQLRSGSVDASENVTRTDAKRVLSGEELPATSRVTFDFTLKAKFIQDHDLGGVVDWSWINRGTDQDFILVPNDEVERAVKGVCKPVPITIGGDVGDPSPEADVTWRIEGTPVRGTYIDGVFEEDE